MLMDRMDLQRLPSNAPPALRALIEGRITMGELRALRPLPENAGKLIDDAVIRVGLDRLQVVGDLIEEGLTFDIGEDFWGITQVQWDEINEVGYAHRTMEPLARGENQLPDRRPRVIPIYLTWDDFELGIRALNASRRGGAPLDTTLVEQATRRVNEAIEDSMINGVPFNVFGSAVPGLLNAPNVSSYLYETAGGATTAWDDPSKTGAEIISDVMAMIALAQADRKNGPYNLYIPSTYELPLGRNYVEGTTTFDVTIRERLERLNFGGRPLRIRQADMLPANKTVLVQMTRDVLDVVIGQQPTVISWEGPSGWDLHWVVLACVVPRVKTTYSDQSGIVIADIS